jgi:chromosomal replication initiation ATPase DnaA
MIPTLVSKKCAKLIAQVAASLRAKDRDNPCIPHLTTIVAELINNPSLDADQIIDYVLAKPRDPGEIADKIIAACAAALNIDAESIRSRTRCRLVIECRSICVYIIRKCLPGVSYAQIAPKIGLKDHSSVVHMNTRAANLLSVNDAIMLAKYQVCRSATAHIVNAINNGK